MTLLLILKYRLSRVLNLVHNTIYIVSLAAGIFNVVAYGHMVQSWLFVSLIQRHYPLYPYSHE